MKLTRLHLSLGAIIALLAAVSAPLHAQQQPQQQQQEQQRGTTPAQQPQGGTAAPSGQRAGTATAPVSAVVVLLPTAQASDKQLGNGCWVRFYEGENYQGYSLTVVGPVDVPRMDVPGPAWREWDSAIVGPKARVTTFDNENFHDRTANLVAGQRVPDLDEQTLGWFDEVHSARVSCTK